MSDEIVNPFRGIGGRYEVIDGEVVQVEPPTQEPQQQPADPDPQP